MRAEWPLATASGSLAERSKCSENQEPITWLPPRPRFPHNQSAHTRLPRLRALVTASSSIPTQPERAYAVIANYQTGHHRILPEQFSGLTVERGGIGAGTIIRFDLRLLGRKQRHRAAR